MILIETGCRTLQTAVYEASQTEGECRRTGIFPVAICGKSCRDYLNAMQISYIQLSPHFAGNKTLNQRRSSMSTGNETETSKGDEWNQIEAEISLYFNILFFTVLLPSSCLHLVLL